MLDMVKRFVRSAPIWAWFLMLLCVVAIVVGLIVAGNRTAPSVESAPPTTHMTQNPPS